MVNRRDMAMLVGIPRFLISFLEYALMWTVIVECFSFFHYSENYRKTTLEVVVTLIALCLAVIILSLYRNWFKKEIKVDLRKNWAIWSVLFGLIILFLIVNVMRIGGENAVRKYTLSFLLFLPVIYVLLRFYRIVGKPYELLYKHSDLVCALAAYNLIVYSTITFHPEIVQSHMFNSFWGVPSYLRPTINYLNICCIDASGTTRTIAGFTVLRNMGFFPEPLMYCIPLITALFTEMYLRKKENRHLWKWILLIIAVFTTQATLGMILTVGAIGIKLIESVKPKYRLAASFLILVFAIIAVFVLVRQKGSAEGSIGDRSTASHIAHYVIALKAFLDQPLVGCGYLHEDVIFQFLSSNQLQVTRGLSNSVASVLAQGGILLGLLCMSPFFIGLAHIKTEETKDIALWTLGPLGLYCLIPYHFHLLLMLFMAFGYSMLEVSSVESGKRRLILSVDTETPYVREHLSQSERIAKVTAILLGCSVTAGLFLSGGLWKTITRWMELHQLLFGQSAWKAYFFSLFLVFSVLVLRKAIRSCRKMKEACWLPEMVWFLLYSILFAASYPAVYSLASTALDIVTPFGDFFETAALAGLYFGGVAVGWLLIALLRSNKRRFAVVLAAVAILVAGVTVGFRFYVSRIDAFAGEISEVITAAAEAAVGKIYANERPSTLKKVIPEIVYTPARDGSFTVLENASVITAHDRDLRDLLNAGYEVAELSRNYVLYSNDLGVIEALQNQGYIFFKYYPFPMSTENESAVILKSGGYTLTAELERPAQKDAPHEPIGSIQITSFYGTRQVKTQLVYADDFDADGCCRIEIPFNAGNWEGMAYQFVPEEGIELRTQVLTLRETPTYLTQTTYDGRFLVVKESYFDLDGEPYYHSDGYAVTTKAYDRAGRLIEQAYFDGDYTPVRIKSGYASYTRDYNSQGKLGRETYYDENGILCLLKQGYASIERAYDRKGNVTDLRYLGETLQPVMTTMGYAEVKTVYNAKRQILEQSYYDETGASILLPDGYFLEIREYDVYGNLAVQRYFDTEEKPVITAMGYAEIRKEYNEAKKAVREEYYGVDGSPVALANGAASQTVEYGTDGKVSARHYFDLNGMEFTPEA